MMAIDSTLFIIFGVTGDLARKKLLPALQILAHNNPTQKFFIMGVAKDPIEDIDFSNQVFAQFEDRFSYMQIDANNADDYARLHHSIVEKMKLLGIRNRLLYCAVGANLYAQISQLSHDSGIIQKGINELGGQDTIVYEKPFGWDRSSALAIHTKIQNLFDDSQIFCVDHYLTKSLVTSLMLLRFSNTFFKTIWSHQSIEQIQIIFSEKVAINERGEFFDAFGALKDVAQNHILQLLSLLAMEEPEIISAESCMFAKTEVLQKTEFISGLFGQYEGYLQEKGIKPNSKTETFVALELSVNTPRWQHVPFFVKTGKNLGIKSTEIHIILKNIHKDIFGAAAQGPNSLVLHISPQGGFELYLTGQKPCELYQSERIKLTYSYECNLGPEQHSTYELLLHHILLKDRLLAVSFDEIDAAWRIIDDIKDTNPTLYSYMPGTSGPAEADHFMAEKQVAWKA